MEIQRKTSLLADLWKSGPSEYYHKQSNITKLYDIIMTLANTTDAKLELKFPVLPAEVKKCHIIY